MRISYRSSPEFHTLKLSNNVFSVLGLSNSHFHMSTFVQSMVDVNPTICGNFCWYIYLWHRKDPRTLNISIVIKETADHIILSMERV